MALSPVQRLFITAQQNEFIDGVHFLPLPGFH
jgi:hypothetical protein